MADEIEFIENYKTHVASAVIMMKVCHPIHKVSQPIHASTCATTAVASATRCTFILLHALDCVVLTSCFGLLYTLLNLHVCSSCLLNLFLQAALPHLIKSKGNIVNMSSMMSQTYKTVQMAYNASKAMEDAVRCLLLCPPCCGPYSLPAHNLIWTLHVMLHACH